ncbi:hypothetical protein ALQ32_05183 [Pseudomonas syringae pv. tagetis]|uniref:Uncharacterized protein n=1 Tax=Pseudomonas syringae pv. tagetis TaxID=129140 RepID=A0A3M3Z826_9PSED|nr:hypothetical protein ALQ32_05183 [Pseudomonas syringae pv. tagetis]
MDNFSSISDLKNPEQRKRKFLAILQKSERGGTRSGPGLGLHRYT